MYNGRVRGSTRSRKSIPEPLGAGSTRSPIVARNGFDGACRISTACAGADRSLDADRRRLAEGDVDAEVVRQRGLDDLLLHLAVERHRELLAQLVLPDVDQRVLFGELTERDVQRALVGRSRRGRRRSPGSAARSDDSSTLVRRRADRVADPDLAETPQLARSRPAATDPRRTAEPRSKTLIAVTFPPLSGPNLQSIPRPHGVRRTCERRRPSRRPDRARS